MEWWLNATMVAMEDLIPVAQAAEKAGFAGLSMGDHLVYPETLTSAYPYSRKGKAHWNPQDPWPDTWVTIAAMATATQKLRFTTGVYVAPLRDPFSLAKATGTASALSGGRLICGFGVGWMKEEFDLLQTPFKGRGARLDEQIEVLRLLWSGEMVGYHGAHFDFDPVQMSPAVGKVPIYIGGLSQPALRRAARNDGWIGVFSSVEETSELMTHMRTLRADTMPEGGKGEEGEPFHIMINVTRGTVEDGKRLLEAGADSVCMPILGLTRSKDAGERLDAIAALGQSLGLS